MNQSNLTIAAAGDLVPTRRMFQHGAPISPGLRPIQELLRGAAIAFGDLEVPYSTSGTPREKLITFRVHPGLAPDVREFGFDILSLANNHTMDYGEAALLETIEVLDANGIKVVGAGPDLKRATAPTTLEVDGWRVAFLAWSCLLPAGSAAGPHRAGHAPIHVRTAYETDPYTQIEEPGHPPIVRTWPDPVELALAQDAVHAIRNQVDLVIVSAHWGFGFGTELAEYQPLMGHALIDAGADIILGNHVHAIHAIEMYKGKAILYSPGNFISQQPRDGEPQLVLDIYEQMSPDGYVALFDVAPGGAYSLRLVPITMDAAGLPILATGPVFQRIADRLIAISAPMNADVKVEGKHLVVTMSA